MKKLFLVLTLVILLIGSVVVAKAANQTRITGGMNYPYADGGWAWAEMNITIDPLTGEANGFGDYRSYSVDKPKDWGGWYGNAICGAVGEYEGMPAAVVVLQLEETTDFTVGQYIKFLIADGGQPATEDFVGLIVFPPADIQPNCDFEMPLPYEGFTWYGVGGNITIHQ